MSGEGRRAWSAASVADYDEVVCWDRRLEREGPFFEDVFSRAGVASVVDVGCGTGMHAILFASWGLDVLGIDPSEDMLARARENAEAAGADVRFVTGAYGDVAGLVDGPVDAVVSLGNAFMHVEPGTPGVGPAVSDMASVLRPGGVLVLHFLNHDRLLAQRPPMLPPAVRETPEGDKVFLKLLSYPEGEIVFEMITLTRTEGGWDASSRISRHAPLAVRAVADAFPRAGLTSPDTYGAHDLSAFDAAEDESVVMVGYKE